MGRVVGRRKGARPTWAAASRAFSWCGTGVPQKPKIRRKSPVCGKFLTSVGRVSHLRDECRVGCWRGWVIYFARKHRNERQKFFVFLFASLHSLLWPRRTASGSQIKRNATKSATQFIYSSSTWSIMGCGCCYVLPCCCRA